MLYVRMKNLRQVGMLVLLLVTCLLPAMACMVPAAQMSAQERVCCRTMSTQCGQTDIQTSRGCCQKTPASLYDHALSTKTAEFHPVAVRVIWLPASDLVNPIAAVTAWVERPDYTPPKFPLPAISILRI
jgi:hypothetical protein